MYAIFATFISNRNTKSKHVDDIEFSSVLGLGLLLCQCWSCCARVVVLVGLQLLLCEFLGWGCCVSVMVVAGFELLCEGWVWGCCVTVVGIVVVLGLCLFLG